jgi:hypothetical protein
MIERSIRLALVPAVLAACAAASPALAQTVPTPSGWRQHEMNRPHPPAVTPAPHAGQVQPPADAIVLFDGRDLSAFVTGQGAPAGWKVENGYMEVVPGSGSIRTREEFGDVQLHLEWATANPPVGTGQNRSNSGVILMGRYEIQVLDSYGRTDTYPDGQAASIYGQYPPLVNASRGPGEWQTYDIIFRRPRFNDDGSVREPARVTVLHNGVAVQANETLWGPTSPPPPHAYVPHADAAPFSLQDHNELLRYRNIWVRRLEDRPAPPSGYEPAPATLTPAQLDRFVGNYYRVPAPGQQQPTTPTYTVTREGNQLMVRSGTGAPVPAIAVSENRIWITGRASEATFTFGGQAGSQVQVGNVTAVRRD